MNINELIYHTSQFTMPMTGILNLRNLKHSSCFQTHALSRELRRYSGKYDFWNILCSLSNLVLFPLVDKWASIFTGIFDCLLFQIRCDMPHCLTHFVWLLVCIASQILHCSSPLTWDMDANQMSAILHMSTTQTENLPTHWPSPPPLHCCRYDGRVPNDAAYPTVQVRDPRSALTRIWARMEVAELTVPKFRVRTCRRAALLPLGGVGGRSIFSECRWRPRDGSLARVGDFAVQLLDVLSSFLRQGNWLFRISYFVRKQLVTFLVICKFWFSTLVAFCFF